MTLYAKHRTASGDLGANRWEYDPQRRLVLALLRSASTKRLSVEIRVCSNARPAVGAHCIFRLNEDMWRISLAAYVSADLKRSPVPASHHPLLPADEVILTHAPADISVELSRL